MAPPDDPRDAEIARRRATATEWLGVVADLRRRVESQHAHIDELVALTFGRRTERIEGPPVRRRRGPRHPRPAVGPRPE